MDPPLDRFAACGEDLLLSADQSRQIVAGEIGVVDGPMGALVGSHQRSIPLDQGSPWQGLRHQTPHLVLVRTQQRLSRSSHAVHPFAVEASSTSAQWDTFTTKLTLRD